MSNEKHPIDKVRSFLKEIAKDRANKNYHAYAYLISENSKRIIRAHACHAGLTELKNPIVLGSGFLPTEDQMEVADKYWRWVTDPDISPWKALMTNGIELVIGDDKLPVGWILPEKTLRETPFYFQKNFCIATRVFTEKYEHHKIWAKLVDKKMHPGDAYYLASMLDPINKTKANPGYTLSMCANLSGSHWPISDIQYQLYGPSPKRKQKAFNFRMFKTGDYNKEHKANDGLCTINGYFQSFTENMRNSFNLLNCKQSVMKGSFSQTNYYELNDIIDEFYKWQDVEGVLDV